MKWDFLYGQLQLRDIDCTMQVWSEQEFFAYYLTDSEEIEEMAEHVLSVKKQQTSVLLEMKNSGYITMQHMTVENALFQLQQIFVAAEKWKLAKENAAFLSPEVLTDIGGKLLLRPLMIVDNGYRYLARNEAAKKIFPEEYVTEEQIAGLTWEKDFFAVQSQRDSFFFAIENDKQLLCRNLFLENQYFARVIASGGEGRITKHFQQVFDEIADALLESLAMRGSEYNQGKKSIAFKKQIEQLLQGKVPLSDNIWEQYGWKEEQTYQILRFRISDRYPTSVSEKYVHKKISGAFGDCCVIHGDKDLICVRNVSLSESLDLYRILGPFLRENLMKCGISKYCSRLSEISIYDRQAADALQIGTEKAPDFWYYSFQDYAFHILMQYGTQRYPLKEVVSPAVLLLQQYDREHKTELFATLCAYLKHNENTTHAAKQMNIQRSSLLKRLNRIESLTKTDITKEHLYLSVSCYLIEEKCGIYKKTLA